LRKSSEKFPHPRQAFLDNFVAPGCLLRRAIREKLIESSVLIHEIRVILQKLTGLCHLRTEKENPLHRATLPVIAYVVNSLQHKTLQIKPRNDIMGEGLASIELHKRAFHFHRSRHQENTGIRHIIHMEVM
jgi:hypothetical protein